jgi:phage-related protein
VASKGALVIRFIGDTRDFNRSADAVQKKFGKTGAALDRAGQAAGKGLAVGIAAGSVALFKMSKAAAEDAAAQEKLHTALRNNTFANDASIAKIEEWINATSLASGVADDELRPALQRLAETSGSASEAQAQLQIAMDVAAGTGKSLKSVTEAMAKANNGSLGGLSRLGVKTKDAAGKTVTLDNALKQMSSTFKGQAAKAADTAAGRQKRLTVAMSELGEQIGTAVLPAFEKFTAIGLKVTAWVSNHTTLVGSLVAVVAGLAVALYTASLAMRAFATASAIAKVLTTVAKGVMALNAALWANPVLAIVAGIILLVGALVLAYKKSETFRKIVNAAFGAVANAAKAAFGWVKDKAMAAFNWIKANWKTLLAILVGPIGIAVLVISRNWDKIKAGAQTIVEKIRSVASSVRSALVSAFEFAKDRVTATMRAMLAPIQWVIDKVQALISKLSGIRMPKLDIPGFDIPGFARGVSNFRGGMALVGERGPELVRLPRGTDVIPNHRLPVTARTGAGGATINATFNISGGDPRRNAEEIRRMLLRLKRDLGGDLGLA